MDAVAIKVPERPIYGSYEKHKTCKLEFCLAGFELAISPAVILKNNSLLIDEKINEDDADNPRKEANAYAIHLMVGLMRHFHGKDGSQQRCWPSQKLCAAGSNHNKGRSGRSSFELRQNHKPQRIVKFSAAPNFNFTLVWINMAFAELSRVR